MKSSGNVAQAKLTATRCGQSENGKGWLAETAAILRESDSILANFD
jgi:hypothetical protein